MYGRLERDICRVFAGSSGIGSAGWQVEVLGSGCGGAVMVEAIRKMFVGAPAGCCVSIIVVQYLYDRSEKVSPRQEPLYD